MFDASQYQSLTDQLCVICVSYVHNSGAQSGKPGFYEPKTYMLLLSVPGVPGRPAQCPLWLLWLLVCRACDVPHCSLPLCSALLNDSDCLRNFVLIPRNPLFCSLHSCLWMSGCYVLSKCFQHVRWICKCFDDNVCLYLVSSVKLDEGIEKV